MSMPDVTVEVAFVSAPGAEAPVWTDVSADWMSITTNRGRNQELDRYQAGTCTVKLKDTARKYDPSNAASPYAPNVQVMKRLRVRATWNAVTYDVYQGFIESYDHEYEGTPNGMAVCTIRATDGFMALEAVELPSSPYAVEVAADLPVAWWRLDETSGTVAVNANGYQLYDLTYYGAPASAPGLVTREPGTAINFTGSEYLQGPLAGVIGNTYTIEAWVKLLPVDVAPHTDDGSDWIYSQPGVNFQVNHRSLGTLGQLTFSTGGVFVESSVRVDDNVPHHVVARRAAGTLSIWVDGVDRTSGAGAATGDVAMGMVNIGRNPATPVGWNAIYGVLDEVAIYEIALSDARIAAHNAAGRTPWTGDTPGARLTKILNLAGWPGALRNLDTGSVTLQSAELGMTALEHAQKVADSDFGALFITAAGAVRFIGRAGLYNRPELFSFGDDPTDPTELGYRSIKPEYTAALIRNDVTVSRAQGVAQRAQDAASIAAYFRHTYSVDGLIHDSDALSKSAAEFLVTEYKDPRRRVSSMVVAPRGNPNRVGGRPEDLFPPVLSLELADQIRVEDRPPGGGAVNVQDTAIEGIAHTITPMWWETEWALAPSFGSAGVGTVWVWDETKWDEHRWAFRLLNYRHADGEILGALPGQSRPGWRVLGVACQSQGRRLRADLGW